jgi:uncharacterized protein (DUF1810 family)
MTDPYNLERFVGAQDNGGTYDRAIEELRRGAKTSHGRTNLCSVRCSTATSTG